jgi:hypothetical protein
MMPNSCVSGVSIAVIGSCRVIKGKRRIEVWLDQKRGFQKSVYPLYFSFFSVLPKQDDPWPSLNPFFVGHVPTLSSTDFFFWTRLENARHATSNTDPFLFFYSCTQSLSFID